MKLHQSDRRNDEAMNDDMMACWRGYKLFGSGISRIIQSSIKYQNLKDFRLHYVFSTANGTL